jgi:hypothetical protein
MVQTLFFIPNRHIASATSAGIFEMFLNWRSALSLTKVSAHYKACGNLATYLCGVAFQLYRLALNNFWGFCCFCGFCGFCYFCCYCFFCCFCCFCFCCSVTFAALRVFALCGCSAFAAFLQLLHLLLLLLFSMKI